MKQVILCVETSKKANTDGLYISKALKSLYRIDNSVKLTYVYCEGKPKYASKLKEINDAKTKIKDSIVVYLFDTDSIDIDVKHQNLNEEIIKYCNSNNFEFVWFYRDIEEVFLHHSVPNNSKTKEAAKFSNTSNIGKATIDSLSSNELIRYRSNFMLVFNKYLDKKQ